MKNRRTISLFGVLLLNLAGAAIYLKVASQSWIEPEVANIPGASGGSAFFWLFTAVPILAMFALVDLFVVPLQTVAHLQKREWFRALMSVSVPILWVIAVYVDFAHHGV